MLTLLIAAAAAATPTAVDTERALSREARSNGQWTATRAYADPDAVMFTPQAIWARDFLKGRKDPAKSTRWAPSTSYESCDGHMAVNTGPWTTSDGRQGGFFTTVWQNEGGRWRWISNGRHTLKRAVAARKVPTASKASCRGTPPGPPLMKPPVAKGEKGATPDDFGRGVSADKTLGWDWRVGSNGGRQFRAFLWNGRGYEVALKQTIGGK